MGELLPDIDNVPQEAATSANLSTRFCPRRGLGEEAPVILFESSTESIAHMDSGMTLVCSGQTLSVSAWMVNLSIVGSAVVPWAKLALTLTFFRRLFI